MRDSCLAFLCLREEKEGLTGDARDKEEGDERAEADEGRRRGGGRRASLRGGELDEVAGEDEDVASGAARVEYVEVLWDMVGRPEVASERAGRGGRVSDGSRVVNVCADIGF